MKKIILKAAAAGILAMGMVSCADELNISSIDPKSSSSYDATELLAKQYATLGLTGQVGPTGNSDISGDEGEIGFYRTTFNLQELGSDECIWAWQTDPDIPQITSMRWTSASTRVYWAYQRLSYDISLYNSFLSEQEGLMDASVLAEVRFLRALHYWYYLDLFHKAPFKTNFSMSELPVEKAGAELYDWIDKELTEIEALLPAAGTYNSAANFGRADAGAAYMLHARLALNSAIYTDGQVKDYEKAINYSNKLIDSGVYALSTATNANGYTGYEQVFMGDNDKNPQAMKEIIFPIRQDGTKTQEHSGSTYLVSSMRASGMPYSFTDNYWTCNYARKALVQKFFDDPENDCPWATEQELSDADLPTGTEAQVIAADKQLGGATEDIVAAAGDDRALFYAGVGGGTRTVTTSQITGFLNGFSIVKWQNRRSDNSAVSNSHFSDTDIPLFRLAEAYLTRAEAEFYLGQTEAALRDVNVLRARAHTTPFTSIDRRILADEWCREFYMEGRRRSDLVRFGFFTSSQYLWDFKGGVATGTGVDAKYNIYPIPDNDIAGNPNMSQNPGY